MGPNSVLDCTYTHTRAVTSVLQAMSTSKSSIDCAAGDHGLVLGDRNGVCVTQREEPNNTQLVVDVIVTNGARKV